MVYGNFFNWQVTSTSSFDNKLNLEPPAVLPTMKTTNIHGWQNSLPLYQATFTFLNKKIIALCDMTS